MPIHYVADPAGGGLTTPTPAPDVNPEANTPQDLVDEVDAASVDPGLETPLDWVAYLQRMRSLNDAIGGAARAFDGTSNPTTWNDLLTHVGDPVSGLEKLPTFAAASGFAVTVGAGNGNVFTSVGIGAGESTYRRVYWSSQNLTHANPDPTNPRFDAITVTPAAFGTESVLAVVTGTPSATPAAPAISAGSFALFYVYVRAAAANSGAFRACRGLGRRAGYPWSGMSAIIAGCELSWEYLANHNTTAAALFVGAADQTGTDFTVNRILIDGELIEWAGWLSSNAGLGVVSDSGADPFGTSASASFDKPYYIYAVGGRHNPMPSNNGTGLLNPITVCESLVPPNPKTGKPTSNMTVNGVTVVPDGALYIGLGFVAQNTTLRRGCLMDNEMTMSLMPLQVINHTFTTGAYEDIGTFAGGALPAISTKMRINALFGNADTAATGAVCGIKLGNVPSPGGLDSIGPLTLYAGPLAGPHQTSMNGVEIAFTPRTSTELWAVASNGSAGSSLLVAAMGFDHRVRRVVAGY